MNTKTKSTKTKSQVVDENNSAQSGTVAEPELLFAYKYVDNDAKVVIVTASSKKELIEKVKIKLCDQLVSKMRPISNVTKMLDFVDTFNILCSGIESNIITYVQNP